MKLLKSVMVVSMSMWGGIGGGVDGGVHVDVDLAVRGGSGLVLVVERRVVV